MPDSERHPILGRLEAELDSLKSISQLRRLEQTKGINFLSNDYLGLSTDPRLKEAVIAAVSGGVAVSSTGSRLLSGNDCIWEELESECAEFAGTESALYFSSGYAANVGLLSGLLRPEDIVFSDRANHASIIDGIRLSGAEKVVFPHLDLNFLEDTLREHRASPGQKFIVTESVFSMEGDCAPLADLQTLASCHGAELILDEAHATGVLGPEGRGLLAAARGTGFALATVHTCGKALASMGAFVCCSEMLKQYLVNRARTFIYSTALPPYLAAQARAAIQIARTADPERQYLSNLGAFLRGRLRDAGFNIGASSSQIVPVYLGSNEAALRTANELERRGFSVRAIRPPTVPPGTARLRLSLNANLAFEDLGSLLEALLAVQEQLAPAAAVHDHEQGSVCHRH